MNTIHKLVNPIDVESLKHALDHAVSFPHFCIDNFLVADFANEIEASFPDFNLLFRSCRLLLLCTGWCSVGNCREQFLQYPSVPLFASEARFTRY